MLKKKILHRGMSENILSPEGWGKKFYPRPNYPYPSSKVKWSAPNSRVRWPISCRICDNKLVSFYQNTDTSVTLMSVLKTIYYINSIFKYSCKCDFLFCTRLR